MKNDGYIPEEGKYFQIFGPEERTDSSESQAIRKFKTDFFKLKEHCDSGNWEIMKKFNFVYNDKNKGISPKLEKMRIEIEKSEKIKCKIVGIAELLELYDEVNTIKKIYITNYDEKILKDLKEKFYDTGLIDKLEEFYFGRPCSINYFDFPNGDSSADYIEYKIDKNPYYIFLNEKYENLRKEFYKNYFECMELLGINYFFSKEKLPPIELETIHNHIKIIGPVFEEKKIKAVISLKTLLRTYYIEINKKYNEIK